MSEPATEEGLLLLDDLTNHNRRDVRLRYGWSREELAPRIAKAEQQARADAEATIQRLREQVEMLRQKMVNGRLTSGYPGYADGYAEGWNDLAGHVEAVATSILADTAPEGAAEERSLYRVIERAVAILERPHKHDWRPDLVTCGVEQDALSILRTALLVPTEHSQPSVARNNEEILGRDAGAPDKANE